MVFFLNIAVLSSLKLLIRTLNAQLWPKNSPSGRAKMNLLTLFNVELFPNQVIHSWFLTWKSKNTEGADGNHK